MSQPTFVRKRAIDVTPWRHAIWCTVGGGKPFANTIESRSWCENGTRIWFLLGTHNFYSARPDETIEVIEVELAPYRDSSRVAEWDAKAMARPSFDEGEPY